ncbi:MAG TPA: thiamine-binding protein [Dehalococcoidia bacterium]|nr:thiamine-binding protein [Dehalococcoidia bacterium]
MGTAESKYAHIEAAIALIEQSGLTYEVGALGTTVEGPPDVLWHLMRRVHESVLRSGAEGTMTVLKVEETATAGPSIADLTGKFR